MALAPVDFFEFLTRLWNSLARRSHRTRPNTQIVSEETRATVSNIALPDDLSRDVYCVLGMPIDAIDMAAVLDKIDAAAASKAPFLISTPNLNFLVNSQADPEFREVIVAQRSLSGGRHADCLDRPAHGLADQEEDCRIRHLRGAPRQTALPRDG